MKPTNITDPFVAFGANTANDKNVLKSFSDELLSMRGKIVELYIGDQSANMDYDEMSIPQNSSIYGELVDVFDRFIVLHCLYLDHNNQLQHGNKVYINAFQIRAMSILDDRGSLNDIFLNVRDAAKVRKILREKKA